MFFFEYSVDIKAYLFRVLQNNLNALPVHHPDNYFFFQTRVIILFRPVDQVNTATEKIIFLIYLGKDGIIWQENIGGFYGVHQEAECKKENVGNSL